MKLPLFRHAYCFYFSAHDFTLPKELHMGRVLDSFDVIGIIIAVSALVRLTIA